MWLTNMAGQPQATEQQQTWHGKDTDQQGTSMLAYLRTLASEAGISGKDK